MRPGISILAILVSLFLSVAVFGDAPLHAAIPHHHEADGVSTALHQALRHEHKMLPSVPAGLVLLISISWALFALAPAARERAPLALELLLRRGVAPHRRFG